MATSALAGSTVRENLAAGKPLPEGLAIDGHGKPITDPAKVNDGALLPFGSAKGFGLSLLVEILAGVITGAGIGDGVASMHNGRRSEPIPRIELTNCTSYSTFQP